MDMIEISPPKQLRFCLPNDLQQVLTLTNITLKPFYARIVHSHSYQMTVSPTCFVMQAFQETKVQVTIHWNQSAKNMCRGKLRIFICQIQDGTVQINGDLSTEIQTKFKEHKEQIVSEDIDIDLILNSNLLVSEHYRQQINDGRVEYVQSSRVKTKYYFIRRVMVTEKKKVKLLTNEVSQKKLFQLIESKGKVKSIHPFQEEFIIEFTDLAEDFCEFYQEWVEDDLLVYTIGRVIDYSKPFDVSSLIDIYQSKNTLPQPLGIIQGKEQHKKHLQSSKPASDLIPVEISKRTKSSIIFKQPSEAKGKAQLTHTKEKSIQSVKHSFAHSQIEKRSKRRNKSEQRRCEQIDERDSEEEQLKPQMKLFRVAQNYNVKIPKTKKIVQHESLIDLNQRVLNICAAIEQERTMIYVLLRDCVKCFQLEDISAKITIKFDPIDEYNVKMLTPMDIFRNEQLIFANECYLFWVSLSTYKSDWKYVQRKEIYTLAIIDELSLIAIGGKNFSKFAYLGKETARSNIKLYSCNQHEHLFTYDLIGTNVGHVLALHYIATPPNNTKLLLVHTSFNAARHVLYFLRVKAFDKIEMFGHFTVEQLGIQRLLKIKYNKKSNRVLCMQNIGEIDCFKQLKIKCQYDQVQVLTEGMKLPLQRYISYHLGGNDLPGEEENWQRPNPEWLTLVEQNGRNIYIYCARNGKVEKLEVGKGEIRQVFTFYDRKYLLVCADTSLKLLHQQEIVECDR